MTCNTEEVKVEDLKVSSGFKLYEFMVPLKFGSKDTN